MTASVLPALVQRFFTERLCTQMDASPHTIASYRDTFRMLLRFASDLRGRPPTRLRTEELDADLVAAFLDHVETERGNGARSRNTRLAAIRSFFRFVALTEPAHLLQCQQVLALPGKRHVRRNVTFLEAREIAALVTAPDRTTWVGRRDHLILLVAAQTGLRASELIGLRRRDVVLGVGAHIRCDGKGRKERCTPLRRDTARMIGHWLEHERGDADAPLFATRRGSRLSRDALEHLVRRHVATASRDCPSLAGRRISPHVLRHSAAMGLLHHGVDSSVIALWLGHESVETTQVYLHADLKLKERALARVATQSAPTGRYRPGDKLLAFLEAL